jgi:hypothetical protein
VNCAVFALSRITGVPLDEIDAELRRYVECGWVELANSRIATVTMSVLTWSLPGGLPSAATTGLMERCCAICRRWRRPRRRLRRWRRFSRYPADDPQLGAVLGRSVWTGAIR